MRRQLFLGILFLFPIFASIPVNTVQSMMFDVLDRDEDWVAVKKLTDGIFLSEMEIPGIPVKGVKVSQVLDTPPETIAQVVEDVANYGRFLNSAPGMECRLLKQDEMSLLGIQHVAIPLISDRSYGFRMFRPDPSGTRVDWALIGEEELSALVSDDNWKIDGNEYLDIGVGSWQMEAVGNGLHQVSYRLIMDPGGWIPDRVTNYVNQVSIVNLFRDAITEAELRRTNENR